MHLRRTVKRLNSTIRPRASATGKMQRLSFQTTYDMLRRACRAFGAKLVFSFPMKNQIVPNQHFNNVKRLFSRMNSCKNK